MTVKQMTPGKHPGMVASGHPETSAAGRAVLEAGGNAFDAALGALCASTVCEPLLTSLAGGGFLLARAAGAEPEVFDFFVQTPGRKLPAEEMDFAPVLIDFGTAQQEFHVGLGAAAVPGVAAGLFEVHEALGQLPLGEVLAPAIALARRGVEVTPYQAYISKILQPILACSEEAMALVTAPDPSRGAVAAGGPAEPGAAGTSVVHAELADLFEFLSREGRRGFYQGEPAQRLLKDCRERGGLLRQEDLDGYRVVRRRPVRSAAFGAEFWFNAPPSPGGSLVAFALALLESPGEPAAGTTPYPWGSAAHALSLSGAMDGANRLRKELLDETLDEALARRMLDDEQLQHWRAQALPSALFKRGTTHLSVVDGAGNIASLSSSNGEGCGYVIPGTGVMMNNMLGEEDLNPGGFHRWAPDTRLASMMCPTLARLADGSEVALGTGGSNRIRSAVLQVLINLCLFHKDLQEAIVAPRMHLEGEHLDYEGGLGSAAVDALEARWPGTREWPGSSLFFGGVHAVQRFPDGRLAGVGDLRRGGAALKSS